MKNSKLPLELRLIIYNYFDPKDRKVVVNYIDHYINYFIYIDSEEYMDSSFFYNNMHFYFLYNSKFIIVDEFTIDHFLLRKSQVKKCYERIKNR